MICGEHPLDLVEFTILVICPIGNPTEIEYISEQKRVIFMGVIESSASMIKLAQMASL